MISGQQEASFIYENHVAENLDSDHSYLYIDVGAVAPSLLFCKWGTCFKESFNIGTIRILKDQIQDETWEDLKDYVKRTSKVPFRPLQLGVVEILQKYYL